MSRANVTLQVDSRLASLYKRGFPIVEQEIVEQVEEPLLEGDFLTIEDESGAFVAKGYYGQQNKGRGWILSTKKQEVIDVELFIQRIQKAFAMRSRLFSDEKTNAFRLFNGEGDGIGGLTIDFYAEYGVITYYSEGIYSMKEWVIEAVKRTYPFIGLYEKKRFAQKGTYVEDDDFVEGEQAPEPLLIMENGIKYAVYLNDGPMTGIFLDQREVRKRINEDYAKDKTVLNTFSYTGAFSVAAANGGAVQTTSVDLASRSKERTIEQFSVNGLDLEQQRIHVMDVFEYFKYAQKKQLLFDLVVIDPPSFARSKKQSFSVAKDYPALLKQAIAITEKNGVIVASTNNSVLGMRKFKTFVEQAFKSQKLNYTILEEHTVPDDYPYLSNYKESNYLKVLFIKRED
ncbi:class I SAM-dependent rRNA methyltransferase [Alkalicoccobacillus plakortidis]|uniref:Class I SAM-dependent rRNA methyltransferase n=1 Tax=Alkalicoccobacillus plakortidis TaxID=444060 RepID=A0ABT0XJI1_9BACI|nr:class I SAM-dependent rRNA methyltransferase [Alkalicoccobacillus plakortidis]MCM2676051.1 class I SAM-dependent rRNA methyltransferase [Alkalicoccobacillus plakortidis]